MHLKVLALVVLGGGFTLASARAAQSPIPYLSPKFDGEEHLTSFIVDNCVNYKLLDMKDYSGSPHVLEGGWYVVSNGFGSVTMQNGMAVNGDVHLIVCDGQELISTNFLANCPAIEVFEKGSLTIYAQSTDETFMGKVTAASGKPYAGIQGGFNSCITVNGGLISVTGGDYGAGIGGGNKQNGENITVNGGIVRATGGLGSAGIGGGSGGDGSGITVNGGTVVATGNRGMDIGRGENGMVNDIAFTGGNICANASPAASDGRGNPAYAVTVPGVAGSCELRFSGKVGYGTTGMVAVNGSLCLYLPDGTYDFAVLDNSRVSQHFEAVVSGAAVTARRIYDCITFEGNVFFMIETANRSKNWDSDLFFSQDGSTWRLWNGKEVLESAEDGKCYRLYLRGTANTFVCRDENEKWVINSYKPDCKIDCYGNLETLRGASGDDPAVTPMAPNCYRSLFSGCTLLIGLPTMPATALSVGCYANMFRDCTGLMLNEYRKGRTWIVPADAASAAHWNEDMFKGTGGLFTDDPEIGRPYYISFVTLVNPADPPQYNSSDEAEFGADTSFVIRPNAEVEAAQPDKFAYNGYFTVSGVAVGRGMHALRVDFAEATSNAVQASIQAAMPELAEHMTNAVPYTTVHAVAGIYYGIAGSTNLFEVAYSPNVPAGAWTVGTAEPLGTRIAGVQPTCATNQAFYRLQATIVP